MNKRKNYWIWGCVIAAVLLLIIWFFISRSHTGNPGTGTAGDNNPHIGHTAETSPLDTEKSTDLSPLELYLSEQDAIMTDMMEQMAVEPSGNASIDFLKGMIPHHQSAIDMAESYLNHGGSNPVLKELAENIISTQSDEIDQMQTLIEDIKASKETDTEKEQGYLDAYDKMMSSHAHMNHGPVQEEDVEQAFANGMLMHHQMAVDMSKAILDYTDNEAVRNLAETIILAQEEEIRTMQDIIEGHPSGH